LREEIADRGGDGSEAERGVGGIHRGASVGPDLTQRVDETCGYFGSAYVNADDEIVGHLA
jgi:hypothetical protein